MQPRHYLIMQTGRLLQNLVLLCGLRHWHTQRGGSQGVHFWTVKDRVTSDCLLKESTWSQYSWCNLSLYLVTYNTSEAGVLSHEESWSPAAAFMRLCGDRIAECVNVISFHPWVWSPDSIQAARRVPKAVVRWQAQSLLQLEQCSTWSPVDTPGLQGSHNRKLPEESLIYKLQDCTSESPNRDRMQIWVSFK